MIHRDFLARIEIIFLQNTRSIRDGCGFCARRRPKMLLGKYTGTTLDGWQVASNMMKTTSGFSVC